MRCNPLKINEVEALVGITRKNIRFYEAEGLLSPGGTARTVTGTMGRLRWEVLRRIKLLRKLGLPLEEIRQMQHGAYTVGGRYAPPSGVPGRERQLEAAIRFCGTLTDRRERLESWTPSPCWIGWPRWNRRERPYEQAEAGHQAPLFVAPIVVAIVMSVLMAGLIWLFLWAFEVDPAGAPLLPVLALFVAIPAAVVVGVVIALVQRVREIERGRKTMRGTTERRDCRQAAVSAAGTAVWLLLRVVLWVRQAFSPAVRHPFCWRFWPPSRQRG